MKPLAIGLVMSGLAISQGAWAEHETCTGIDWKPQILERFAGIEHACQELVLRDGKKFARFEVKLVRAQAGGNVIVQMKMLDGSHVEGTFFAPSDFHVLSHSGQTTFRVNELAPGDVLDVYIPTSRIENVTLGDDAA
jgi:hypothetical protein